MDSSYRHLAFLLSLGGVPLGCVGDDTSTTSDTGTTTATTSTTGSTGSEGTDATTGGTDPTTGGSATESGTDSTTAMTGTTAGTTTDETTGETSTSTTGGGSVCEEFATFYVDCDPESTYEEALAYCTDLLGELATYGDECVSAAESYFQCQSGLTCREYSEGLGCEETYAALASLCIPEIGETCAAYGAKYEECDGPDEDVDIYCQQEINTYGNEYGEACGQAVDDYFACLSALDCADLLDESGCEKEETIAEDLCD